MARNDTLTDENGARRGIVSTQAGSAGVHLNLASGAHEVSFYCSNRCDFLAFVATLLDSGSYCGFISPETTAALDKALAAEVTERQSSRLARPSHASNASTRAAHSFGSGPPARTPRRWSRLQIRASPARSSTH